MHIKSTTRRAVVAGLAAAPVAATPAVALPVADKLPRTAEEIRAAFRSLPAEVKRAFYALAREDEAACEREASDPIFAAIEAHKQAFHHDLIVSRIRCHMVDCGPDCDKAALAGAEEADQTAWEALKDASWALVDNPPTTIAGALALIEYVEQFNERAFSLEVDPDWRSAIWYWPEVDNDGDPERAQRQFPFDLLSSVVRALAERARS